MDDLIEEPVLRADANDAAVARRVAPRARIESRETASFGADPEPAVGILVQRANQVARQSVGGGDLREAIGVVAHETATARCHPERAVARAGEGAGLYVLERPS